MSIRADSRIFKKYKVLQKIGEGGFSEVYKVELLRSASAIKEIFALKYFVIKSDADRENTIKRFRQEASILEKVKSSHFPRYVDSYIANDEQFLVMEYVEGKNLREMIKRNGVIVPTKAINYMSQICTAIQELHSNNIIHRDIKSNNIIVTSSNDIKILDFGLSLDPNSQRYTQEQKVVGSVYYMAPELCRAHNQPTPKTDIYALGILLYEMLTGEYPIAGKVAHETIKLQKTAPMPKLTEKIQTSQALENVIIKATAKEPSQRYATAWEMSEDLKTSLSEKRVFEKALDAKKIKPKKTTTEIVNSKGFLIAMLTIFGACVLAVLIAIIVLLTK
ncbi:serine/threonine protein kinase [Mycoplasmopsis primatum]|uniref:serine/threonine protein kinase n=1 Tax=Mycoplasmopsis primatum TaxID=55604 RepID=UPI000494E09F|nr:serine/threonine-protein kinase [Mycoplasmopsis primatum]